MERYAQQIDFAHLASVVRGVSALITDDLDFMHKAPNPHLQLSDLVCDLDVVADRLGEATDVVVEDVERGEHKRNPYELEFLRYMKPRDCAERDLNDKVPYRRPAAYLSDDDQWRADLLLAAAAADAFASASRTPKQVAEKQASRSYAETVLSQVKRALWMTQAEFRAVDAMSDTISVVLDERFEQRKQRGSQRKQPSNKQNEQVNAQDTDGAVPGAEMGDTTVSDKQNVKVTAAQALMKEILEARQAENFPLMETLAEQGLRKFPDAEITGGDGKKFNPFNGALDQAHSLMQAHQSTAAKVVEAVVAAAPKAQAAPGVTVIDVTAGVRAAANVATDDDVRMLRGPGTALGDLPAHGTLTVHHNADKGTWISGNVPGDNIRQVLGSGLSGQHWSLSADKKRSFLGRSRGFNADMERIGNTTWALRRAGWNVEHDIDNTGTKPLKISQDRRARHSETYYAASRQQRVEPKAAADVAKPVEQVEVPGVHPGIVALAAEGHFDDDEPFTEEAEVAAPVAAPVAAVPVAYQDMDMGQLFTEISAGRASAARVLMDRLLEQFPVLTKTFTPEPEPEPVDPFAGDSDDELLVKVSKRVPGAMAAMQERISGGKPSKQPTRPVSAPSAVAMPVQPVTVPVAVPVTSTTPDVRGEDTTVTVWIQAQSTNNETRRGLNQALYRDLVLKSGTKGNRPETRTARFRGENKFRVDITVPAGVDRAHVTNLLTMIANRQDLRLGGLTTPAAQELANA